MNVTRGSQVRGEDIRRQLRSRTSKLRINSEVSFYARTPHFIARARGPQYDARAP